MNINIVVFAAGFLITYMSLPYFILMLTQGNCLEKNYLQKEIPISIGVVFVIVQVFICLIISFFYVRLQSLLFLYSVVIVIISLVSLLDDLIGEKKIKGLKQHISLLISGKLTTGGLKAIIGFTASVIISVKLFESWISLIINILIIALFSNIINMFDLRPGRALKVFILISIFLTITAFIRDLDFIIFSVLGIVLAYLPNDIKGLSMMGDIGANFLGMTLGFYSVVSQHFSFKFVLLIILIIIHVVGEFYSFSTIIDKNRLLKYFDNFGRQ